MKVIDITKYANIVKTLQIKHNEIQAYYYVIENMVKNNNNMSIGFKEYWNNFIDCYADYENYKKYFEENVVMPECGPCQWEVNFNNNTLIIQ